MRSRRAFVLALLVCGCIAANASASDKPKDQYYVLTVTELPAAGNYQIDVYNTNPRGFIRSFWWVPPIGLKITALIGVRGGQCKLAGGLTCAGSIAPPSCGTCIGDSMTIQFTATGYDPTFINTSYGGYYIQQAIVGASAVTSVTPYADLPICKKGQVSTKRSPCSAPSR